MHINISHHHFIIIIIFPGNYVKVGKCPLSLDGTIHVKQTNTSWSFCPILGNHFEARSQSFPQRNTSSSKIGIIVHDCRQGTGMTSAEKAPKPKQGTGKGTKQNSKTLRNISCPFFQEGIYLSFPGLVLCFSWKALVLYQQPTHFSTCLPATVLNCPRHQYWVGSEKYSAIVF